MDYFPLIHTNIWDAVIGVPVVLCVTQLIKVFCRVPGIFVPTIALAAGNVVSIVFGHHEHVYAGIFMGFFTDTPQWGAIHLPKRLCALTGRNMSRIHEHIRIFLL